jgi:hypothetical protein
MSGFGASVFLTGRCPFRLARGYAENPVQHQPRFLPLPMSENIATRSITDTKTAAKFPLQLSTVIIDPSE